MINMHFLSFLTLLIISLIATIVMHFIIRYRVLEGGDGFIWKWVVAWLGAWIGTPVVGHWFAGVAIGHVFIVPAFIGAFATAFLATAFWKAERQVLSHRVS
jgi:uncharacterized membrane protein YeaQ/YmgE (transglycosylase-associated protein family)